MSVRVLDLPTGLAGLSLEEAFVPLEDFYARVDAHAAALAPALNLLCHAGCSACCKESVFVTPLEALYLFHQLQTSLARVAWSQLMAAGVATFEAHQQAILSFGHVDCPGAWPPPPHLPAVPPPVDRVAAARLLRFDCPVLDAAGLCRGYAGREMRARLFAVSRLKSRDEYYACALMGAHLDGKEARLMDAEAVMSLLHLHPFTSGEQVIPYYFWRYTGVL